MDRGDPKSADVAMTADSDVGKRPPGKAGNEEADMRAKWEVGMGWRMRKTEIATPAGISVFRIV